MTIKSTTHWLALLLAPAISFLILYVCQVLILSVNGGWKYVFSSIQIASSLALAICWLLEARAENNTRSVLVIGSTWVILLLAVLFIAYNTPSFENFSIFILSYQDYILIWAGMIGGYLITLFLSEKNRKSQ